MANGSAVAGGAMGSARDGGEGIVACGISSDSVGVGVSAGGSSRWWWVVVGGSGGGAGRAGRVEHKPSG